MAGALPLVYSAAPAGLHLHLYATLFLSHPSLLCCCPQTLTKTTSVQERVCLTFRSQSTLVGNRGRDSKQKTCKNTVSSLAGWFRLMIHSIP